MRILYHHRTLGDGAEGVHIREMVEALRLLGHDVLIQALVDPTSPPRATGSVWARMRKSLPGPTFEVGAAALNILEGVSFEKVARHWMPDLVYQRHALLDVAAVLIAKRRGIPVVLEVNQAYSSNAYSPFERKMLVRFIRLAERIALESSSVVAAVSTPLAECLRSISQDPGRVIMVPNGVNQERFKFDAAGRRAVRSRFGLGQQMVLGWSGILREWHRVDLVLGCLADLPELRLMIVGDGPSRPRLERLARELRIEDRIVWTGRVPHEEVATYTSAMDIAVVSGDLTGVASPMKLLEYMAVERAVVAPRLPNIRDVVTDGLDGVLFSPGSQDALTRALRELARDHDRRRRLGLAARQTVLTKRTWIHCARQILQAVSEIAVTERQKGDGGLDA